MPPADPPRVAISPLGHAAVATMAFRASGQLRVAVIVKATFVFAQDRAMLRVEPDPIAVADQHRDGDPKKSVIVASDLVPYRPRTDVVLQGHARAPIGAATARMGVRLMIARGQKMLLDKRLAVVGSPDPARGGEPAPFTQIPLVYELAAAAADNPVGVPHDPHRRPSVLDAWYRPKPVGLGPLGAEWPSRRALLSDPQGALAPIPNLTNDFAWAFYNAAPPDQRIDFLEGDEWVGFEGMNSQIPRIQSCLPGVRGAARLYGPLPQMNAGQPIGLVADTLAIDADRLRASVVWRGSFAAPSGAPFDAMYVVAGVVSPGEPFAFPTSYQPPTAPMPVVSVPAAPPSQQASSSKSKVRTRLAPMNDDALPARPARDMPSGTKLMSDAVSSTPKAPFEGPKIAHKRVEPITLDIPDEAGVKARADKPMPFAPTPHLPPRAEQLPIATPFDRLARSPHPPPPDESESSELETAEIARDLPPRLSAPPPFEPREEPPAAIAPPPLIGGEAPRPDDAPKTLGQAFLEAMARAAQRGKERDSLAR